jgi:hypothetical protein
MKITTLDISYATGSNHAAIYETAMRGLSHLNVNLKDRSGVFKRDGEYLALLEIEEAEIEKLFDEDMAFCILKSNMFRRKKALTRDDYFQTVQQFAASQEITITMDELLDYDDQLVVESLKANAPVFRVVCPYHEFVNSYRVDVLMKFF